MNFAKIQRDLIQSLSAIYWPRLKIFALLIIFGVSLPQNIQAQDEEHFEVLLFLKVQDIGGLDVAAVIKGEDAYLSVTEVFSFLKIFHKATADYETVSGFFISQDKQYVIEKSLNQIRYNDKTYQLKPDEIIHTESGLYLKVDVFSSVFGLTCDFHFRTLSVDLKSKVELPVIRKLKQEEMRANLKRLKGEEAVDTIIGRDYPVFQMGMADWSVVNRKEHGGYSETRGSLALGSVLLGGEAIVRLNYNTKEQLAADQQQYLWHWVDNNDKALRQMKVGKIPVSSTASIFDPIIGIQLSNSPTTYRRSFGTYNISNVTDPGWIVELYVNNVLVEYTKADASGFYQFEVPIVYGNSKIMLRFYGPWGEERTEIETINIPFNFLPKNEFEYVISSGIVTDSVNSRFMRPSFNYGLGSRISIGGGYEALSSVKDAPIMPFFKTSVRLIGNLLFSGEYNHGIRAKGILNYRLPSNVYIEASYSKYDKEQKAIIFNYLEERKLAVSAPIRFNKFAAFTRFTANQIILPNSQNTNLELLFSGALFRVNTNLTTYALFNSSTEKAYVYSNLSLGFRLPGRISLMPHIQYDYTNKQVISMKCQLEKPISTLGLLRVSYEKNFRAKHPIFQIGFKYDFSFAKTGYSGMSSNNKFYSTFSANGSLLYDKKSDYIGFNNRVSVGKGGVVVQPFVDLNYNGEFDEGEPKELGLTVRFNGGRVIKNKKDSTIRVMELTPYTSYRLELDRNGFDNIAWKIDHESMSVSIGPNQFKRVEVPIYVVGEVAGIIKLNDNGKLRGLGRVYVNILDEENNVVAKTITEYDGYYSYLGLMPGKYHISVDESQLSKLKMQAETKSIPVVISGSVDGDFIDGNDIVIKRKN